MMTKEEFLNKMTEILDAETEVSLENRLADFEEWDSLAFVSVLAMIKVACDQSADPRQVREAKTVADLYDLARGEARPR